jgi:hypothetical protein
VRMALLAFDREHLMVAALAALMVAGLVVAFGAFVLLRRERRAEPEEEPSAETPGGE